MGGIGEYAFEEHGIVELDGKLLEAGRVSWKPLDVLALFTYTSKNRRRPHELSHYGCFSVVILAFIVCMEGKMFPQAWLSDKREQKVLPIEKMWK